MALSVGGAIFLLIIGFYQIVLIWYFFMFSSFVARTRLSALHWEISSLSKGSRWI